MSSADLAQWITGGGMTGVLATATLYAKKILGVVVEEKVREAVQPVTESVTALGEKLAKETGGNSNGLRQKLDEVDGKVDRLSGAFEQYTRDHV